MSLWVFFHVGQLVWDEAVDEPIAPRLVKGCVDVLSGLEVVLLCVSSSSFRIW